MLLQISQNSQENACATVSFLIKLQTRDLQRYYKKEALAQVLSCEICKSTFFHRTQQPVSLQCIVSSRERKPKPTKKKYAVTQVKMIA